MTSNTPLPADCTREMRPYAGPLHTAPHGKRGYLDLGFELDGRGRSILRHLERHTPLIVQQELYFDEAMPEMPCVYILSSGGPNVDGDRYEQRFTVRRDAFAHITTGAATKLAVMHRNYSRLRQHIELEQNAYLEYLPEPVIPCRHTRYQAETTVRIDPTATLVYAEIYLSGRRHYGTGERFCYDILSVRMEAERPDATPLFHEKFIIRPAAVPPEQLGVMKGYDIFANAVALTPPDKAASLCERTKAFIDRENHLAAGITRLPNDCGVSYKVLGNDTGAVKRLVRSFCSEVRRCVKGRPLPEEFPWR